MKKKMELLRGTLDMLILRVVALAPVHGYGISQRLKQISRDVLDVRQGSLYPALHRLEKEGLIRAEWLESDTGHRAKFYSMTRAGRKRLEGEAADWETLSTAISLVLRTAE
jgi:transcriptional regulator